MSQAIADADMAGVGQWVLKGSSTRIRQMAAQAITDPDQLRALIRATRGGNDKNVHRILTGKRDALLAETRAAQQLQADLEETSTAIAGHADRAYDALYAATLKQLEARWLPLSANATEDLQRAVAQYLASAHEVVDRHRQAVEAEAQQKRATALALIEARRQHELEAEAAAAAAAEQARILEAEREAQRQAEQAKQETDDAAAHHLLGLLRQVQAALDHGGTARALHLREAIAEKLPQAPTLPVWYERKLQEIDARLEELKDWKTFTVVPKRAQLLDRMQSLVGAEMSAEELARQIRRLRDEWRTLHRGAGEDPSPEWKQFDEAANRAYEPCREHFARQAEIRKENQQKRETLLERLAAFAAAQSGENADLRAIQQVLVEARNEWREYAPVDQAVVKPLQARFHALADDLKARLDAEYARNVQAKRELIARAAELVKLEDTRQAIEEAKGLQRTWKTIGIVHWNQGNALWDEFRHHCDAIFQRVAQESAAHGAALEAHQARAAAVCDELERMAALPGDELLGSIPKLDELCAEFEALELPRASARDLRQRFSRATDHCADAVRRQRASAARRGWTDLFAAAVQVRAYALATALGKSPDKCEALRIAAAAAVADLKHAPKGTPGILEQQIAKAVGGKISTDLAANEKALRMLCIRAELLANAETPAEDVELRREYQMQRLVASMGRGERVSPASIDDLALEWIAVGPVETVVHDALLARLERCREDGGR